LWYFEAKGLGCLEVDDQLELDWSLDRKLAWFRAIEDAIDIGCCEPKLIALLASVGQQGAHFSEETPRIDGRQAVASRQRCDFRAMDVQETVRHHD
jgi:hypothetical protein